MKASLEQWSSKNLAKFWDSVYEETKEMKTIPTTIYFSRREKKIVSDWFGDLKGKKIFKSDLWDEVKNTNLLSWAHKKGARCYGIDISTKVIDAVKRQVKFINAKVADVRNIPYPDNSFDHVISIGTVEHFPDTLKALKELYRTLKPSGVAFIGVPIKYDLWGRFIFIGLLQKLKVYKYGYEIHYTRKEFKNLIGKAGFRVLEGRGYLIFPSFLRILDYVFHEKNFKLGNKLISRILKIFYKIETKSRLISNLGYCVAYKCIKE